MEVASTGYCRQCGREHQLAMGPALQAALELMAELETRGRVDLDSPPESAAPSLSTDVLFGPGRGKMFGVMVARARDGSMLTHRAFSGQYNGIWEVPGWVGPVFDLDVFHRLQDPEERRIKEMGRRIAEQVPGSPVARKLILERKTRSRELMTAIQGLYRLQNRTGRVASLGEIMGPDTGIPTGTGDCCAPKLLHFAVKHELVPLGLAEFYWGRENASGSRRHGRLYAPCRSRCYPLLGFLLCGLQL